MVMLGPLLMDIRLPRHSWSMTGHPQLASATSGVQLAPSYIQTLDSCDPCAIRMTMP